MKKFEAPMMDIQRFDSEEIIAASGCTVKALGCTSCYCVAVTCEHTPEPPDCPGCFNDWDS